MGEFELQQYILQAINRMSLSQQFKLLAFVNAMVAIKPLEKPSGILQFAGIFDASDRQPFEASIKDCEQIDSDGW